MSRNLLVEILAKDLTIFHPCGVVQIVCKGETNRFIACGSTLPAWLGHRVGLLSALPLFYSTQTQGELGLNQSFGVAGCGMHKPVEVRPLITWVNQGQRSLTDFGPHCANNRFQSQPMYPSGRLRLHQMTRLRRGLQDIAAPVQPDAPGVFLKASWASGSPLRCRGRGTCGDCSKRLR